MSSTVLNHAKISYSKIGEGKEVIIFIHGLGSKGDDWQKQIDFFSQKYSCITLDLRGFGHSQIKPPFTIKQFAADVIDLSEHLKISKFHLVGISLGGMIAFQIAVLKSNLLQSLTIVNAIPEFKLKGLKQHWLFHSRILLIKIFGVEIFGKILAKSLFPKKSQSDLRQEFSESFALNNKQSYLKTLKSLQGWSVVDQIESIGCKILFISSKHDYTSLKSKKFFAEKISAQVVQIKNTHHAAPIERPDEFNEVLSNFLEKI